MTISHWDEVEREVRDVGEMRADVPRAGRRGGRGRGRRVADRRRARAAARARCTSTASEEEIFFVLAGSGLAWIDGAVHEVGVRRHARLPRGRPLQP
jgi:mannose-6-phosphate isomerase-like protein (cupin superfamily)